MTHLMLTSVLLFALLAVVASAIGASLGIARDLLLDEARDSAPKVQSAPAGPATRQGHGLAGDFGLGLRHANRNRSVSPRV